MDRVTDWAVGICSYTKPRGQVPDYDAPVVVPSHKNSVEDFCNRIHKAIMRQFKQYVFEWIMLVSVLLFRACVCLCMCAVVGVTDE